MRCSVIGNYDPRVCARSAHPLASMQVQFRTLPRQLQIRHGHLPAVWHHQQYNKITNNICVSTLLHIARFGKRNAAMDRHAFASAAEARAEEQRQRGLPKSNNNGVQGANTGDGNSSYAAEASRGAGTVANPLATGGSGKGAPNAVTSGLGVTGVHVSIKDAYKCGKHFGNAQTCFLWRTRATRRVCAGALGVAVLGSCTLGARAEGVEFDAGQLTLRGARLPWSLVTKTLDRSLA